MPGADLSGLRAVLHYFRYAAESARSWRCACANHSHFFADLAIKQQAKAAPDAGVLPDAEIVIFDEAHELEDVASSYFGISLSNIRFEELARDVETMLRAKGALNTGIAASSADGARAGADVFCLLPRGSGSYMRRMQFSCA